MIFLDTQHLYTYLVVMVIIRMILYTEDESVIKLRWEKQEHSI